MKKPGYIKTGKDLLRWDLHKRYLREAIIAMQDGNELFFDTLKASLDSTDDQKAKFVETVLGKKSSKRGSFVVQEEFPESLCFGENFRSLIWTPARERAISINVFGGSFIRDFKLIKSMNDENIQEKNVSVPMEEDQFWSMLYLLLKNPKHGKRRLRYKLLKDKIYLLHLKLHSGEVFTVRISFKNGELEFRARDFDFDGQWSEGDIFLYLTKIAT